MYGRHICNPGHYNNLERFLEHKSQTYYLYACLLISNIRHWLFLCTFGG